jgi:hypothetical protein
MECYYYPNTPPNNPYNQPTNLAVFGFDWQPILRLSVGLVVATNQSNLTTLG